MGIKSKFMKALSLLLAIIMLLGSLPSYAVSVSAEGDDYEGYITVPMNYYASSSRSISAAPTKQREAIAAYLNEELKKYSAQIDLSSFMLPYNADTVDLLQTIMSGDLPECFHLSASFSVGGNGVFITKLVPEYSVTEQEYKEMYNECMDVADELLEGIEGNDDLSDVEKALLLHDRVALLCQYDQENYENKTVPYISHTMYGVLGNEVAVCQGYALTYGYLLDQVGIDNYYCSSVTLNHAWNIVYIDGKPYHVDVTWDDPSWDITGRVSHDNFLRSTAGITASGHEASDFDNTPTDTTYDEYFWQHSEAAFTLLDGEIYYIDNDEDHIVRYSDRAFVYDIKSKWWMDATHIWADQARLDTDGKSLLFSLSDGVYKLNLEKGKAKAIYKPRLNSFWGVFGFTLKGDALLCDIYFTPNFDGNTKKIYEVSIPYEAEDNEPTYTPGNINDDENIDLGDVVVLAQCFAGWEVTCNSDALDVNGDGSTNLNDVVHLAQYVAGWEGIELY